MPLYSYQCNQCGHGFELLVRSGDTPLCDSCQSPDLTRLVSRIAPDSKIKGVVKDARALAAKEGHFSNYSKAERAKLR